jgi:hypothetical protein
MAMLFSALLAYGQIIMRNVDDWNTISKGYRSAD